MAERFFGPGRPEGAHEQEKVGIEKEKKEKKGSSLFPREREAGEEEPKKGKKKRSRRKETERIQRERRKTYLIR